MIGELELILRLLLATVLGAAIGFQRERAKKSAGLRTQALIALGACLFTLISVSGFGIYADPSRVAAGVIAGIGFIGGGVIIRTLERDKLSGVTTAASIWVTAAIGMVAGIGMYLIAVIVTVVATLVLMIPKIDQ